MKRGYFWILILVIVISGIFLVSAKPKSDSNNNNTVNSEFKKPADDLRDVHGFAVDIKDSNKLWIANHSGLYVLENDKDLFAVGSKRDDYMGFSQHPTEANTFFTSGHPLGGGNIGFQKTTDGGQSWQKVSNGANGPVDFHAMAVSQIDPNIINGTYRGALQRSSDEGKNWQVLNTNFGEAKVISIATDPTERDTVYAATTLGLLVSRNQGQVWALISESLKDETVTAVAINPKNNQELLAYGQRLGLTKSTDGGQTWDKIDTALASSPVMYMSYDKNNPAVVYATNQSLEIYKTTDNANTWKKVR